MRPYISCFLLIISRIKCVGTLTGSELQYGEPIDSLFVKKSAFLVRRVGDRPIQCSLVSCVGLGGRRDDAFPRKVGGRTNKRVEIVVREKALNGLSREVKLLKSGQGSGLSWLHLDAFFVATKTKFFTRAEKFTFASKPQDVGIRANTALIAIHYHRAQDPLQFHIVENFGHLFLSGWLSRGTPRQSWPLTIELAPSPLHHTPSALGIPNPH